MGELLTLFNEMSDARKFDRMLQRGMCACVCICFIEYSKSTVPVQCAQFGGSRARKFDQFAPFMYHARWAERRPEYGRKRLLYFNILVYTYKPRRVHVQA